MGALAVLKNSLLDDFTRLVSPELLQIQADLRCIPFKIGRTSKASCQSF